MNKLRNIILSLLVVMFVASPVLVVAQTGGSSFVITKSILDNHVNDAAAARNARINAKGNLNDPSYIAAANKAMDSCKNIGQLIEGITNKRYSSGIDGNFMCFAGAVNAMVKPESGFGKYAGRNFTVSADSNIVQTHLLAISNGTETTFDKAMYEEIQKREQTSSLGTMWGGISQFINFFIEGIGNTTASILAGLATLSLSILSIVLDYTQTLEAPNIVARGWTIVRDFMNVFFIIALILMGLGTILRLDAYSVNSKGLLFNLIIMALLINFSKIIAETLIDFSDMLINMFTPKGSIIDYAQTIFSSYVTGGDGFYGYVGYGRSMSEGLANIVGKLVGLTILTISYLAIAALMFVRLVGLWFLIMVSPVAYGLNVIPYTKNYARQWWSTFIKYLTWGPVAMFFFKLAHVFMQEKGNNAFSDSIFDNLFIAAFVFGGFMMAKSTGMYGASSVIGYADKAFSKAKTYGKFGANAVGNYAFVRGGLQGHAALVAGKGMEKFLGAEEGTAKNMQKTAKENWGKATAWAANEPARIKQSWVDNPNAERKKLVDAQQRRSQISRGYMGDFDEEFAKKLKPEEVIYAMQQADFNEAKFNNIMDHGTPQAKMALLLALREGKLQERMKTLKFTEAQQVEAREKLRVFAWKQGGKKESALANKKNEKFMSDELAVDKDGKPVMVPVLHESGELKGQPMEKDGKPVERQITYFERDVILKPKDKDPKKYNPNASIPEKQKNNYIKIDLGRNYVNKESDEKGDKGDKGKTNESTIIQSASFERDPSEGSAADRAARRQEAAKK